MEQTLRGGRAAGDMAEGLGRPLPSPVTKMEMASTTADHLGEQQQQEAFKFTEQRSSKVGGSI